jgi:hypothetical protein
MRTVTRTSGTTSLRPDALAIFSASTTKAGAIRSIHEYVDMQSGEIIPADELNIPTLDLRTKQAEREAVLASLRPEVLAFACFVLRFANKRRGITPGIEKLCELYAKLHGKQTGHVRRYVPRLTEANVLAGENLLGPLFQRTGGTAREHLGEEAHAAAVYAKLSRKDFDPANGKQRRVVEPALLAEEMTRTRAQWAGEQGAYFALAKAMGTETALALH